MSPNTSTTPGSVQVATYAPIHADKLPVKDRSGETLYYVSAAAAARMLQSGRAIALGTKNVTRALQVAPQFDIAKVIPITAYVGQKYSHRNESNDNPKGCWTLKPLARSLAPIFGAVVNGCVKAAA